MTFRVLITGNRDWTDALAIDRELSEILDKHDQFVLMHGACETGADGLARIWGTAFDLEGAVIVEPHPADWNKHGKAAGPIRNSEMVKLGADLVIAFWDGRTGNSGTFDCIVKAVRAGIRKCLAPGAILEKAISDAKDVLDALSSEIALASEKVAT